MSWWSYRSSQAILQANMHFSKSLKVSDSGEFINIVHFRSIIKYIISIYLSLFPCCLPLLSLPLSLSLSFSLTLFLTLSFSLSLSLTLSLWLSLSVSLSVWQFSLTHTSTQIGLHLSHLLPWQQQPATTVVPLLASSRGFKAVARREKINARTKGTVYNSATTHGSSQT